MTARHCTGAIPVTCWACAGNGADWRGDECIVCRGWAYVPNPTTNRLGIGRVEPEPRVIGDVRGERVPSNNGGDETS